MMKRRQFLHAAGAAAWAALGRPGTAQRRDEGSREPLKVCVFSKHLQWLDWERMAQTAAEIGFDGIDLTVRNGGHVLPERVEQDLPKAAEAIRKAGLALPMVTAGIVDTRTPHAESILRTLNALGIPRYRWGGFRYLDSKSIPERLEELRRETAVLAEMNRKYRACSMYHTHSGTEVGASIWDLWLILKDLDPAWTGVNYDIGHATIEGGLGGWIHSFRLISPWMRGVAIKDFIWAKNAKGEWRPQWCPLGEGMVNLRQFLAMLKEAGFAGPVQMHFEYPLGGADAGAKTLTTEKSQVIAAMRRDLATLRARLREAGLA